MRNPTKGQKHKLRKEKGGKSNKWAERKNKKRKGVKYIKIKKLGTGARGKHRTLQKRTVFELRFCSETHERI